MAELVLLLGIEPPLTKFPCFHAGDKANGTSKSDIRPEPIDDRRHAVANADQEAHVQDSPEPPRERAPELQLATVDDGRFSADGR